VQCKSEGALNPKQICAHKIMPDWAAMKAQFATRVLSILCCFFSVAVAQQQPATPASPTVGGAIGWPPKLAVGQSWYVSIERIGDWQVNLTGKDADGDPFGKAQNLRTLSVMNVFFYYNKQKDLAELLLTDGKISDLCQFARYGVSDVAMTGATFVKDATTPFKAHSGFCSATLDDGSGRGRPDLGLPATANQNGAPVEKTNALWPPNLEVGQTWNISIPTVGNWVLKLSAKDKDGDPFGKAQSGGSSLDAYFYWVNESRNAVLQMTDGTSIWGCVFPEAGMNGQTLSGEALYSKDKSAQIVSLNQTCTAELSSGPGIIRDSAPTTPISNDSKLSWPPTIEVGQTWKLQIGAQIYDFELGKLTANVPTGIAKNGTAKLDVFFFYSSKENRAILELSGAFSQIVCNFEIVGVAGSSLIGNGSFRIDKNKPYTPLKDKCIVTLVKAKTTAATTVALQLLNGTALNLSF
jgi:hypothetical protein